LLTCIERLTSEKIDCARAKRQLSVPTSDGRRNEAIETAVKRLPDRAAGSQYPARTQAANAGGSAPDRTSTIAVSAKTVLAQRESCSPARMFLPVSEPAAYYSNRMLAAYSSFRGQNLIEQYGVSPSLLFLCGVWLVHLHAGKI
jgi:hypothetical protein